MKLLTLTLVLILSAPGAWAQTKKASKNKTINMTQQFEGLGSNEDIVEKARALQPHNSMRVVQKREVDRTWRPELGVSYGYVNGGDSYIDTRAWGAVGELHVTPNWSLGVRYNDYKNELNAEGTRRYEDALAGRATAPDTDNLESSMMAILSWYPIYGKVSWLQSVVSQFDFYVLAGGGQAKTTKIETPIYTGGVGMGLWWTSWLSSRIEVRYESYKDRVYSEDRNINGFVGQIGIGFML